MKKLSSKRLLIIVLVVDILLAGTLVFVNSNKQGFSNAGHISESNIQRICELATLECFYHNVTEWKKDGNFFGYGGKKLWIEYDGIVRVGIKAGGQIKISEPDKDGVITVTMPVATILGKDLDEKSIYEIDSEMPMWGFIPLYEGVNTEERKIAISQAQRDMEASASQNGMILDEALNRAKKIIEKNIVSIGESAGRHYSVKFVNASEPVTTSTTEKTP